MKSGVGQEYVINTFGRGIAQDLLHDLPVGRVRDTYIESERMAVNQELINALKTVQGDAVVHSTFITKSVSIILIGVVEMGGYLYTFWVNSAGTVFIYRDDTLIGESSDYPGSYSTGYLYMDTNPDASEIAITDNDQTPVILDMSDMYDQRLTTTYTTSYDKSLYEINQDVGLHQPKFNGLSNMGSGGGLRVGSYAYSYRLVSVNGDKTPWGPPTPFIPVPESQGGFSGDAAKVWPGAKTYGAEPSLEGSRYGIKLKIRIVNEVGFDYIEIRRIANNVGGPVDYSASAEYLRYPESITGVQHRVYEFVDVDGLRWASLDESNTIQNSVIDTARTVRFLDGRLVLGGVKYKSVSFSTGSLFNNLSISGGTDVLATAFKEDLGIGGYKDIYNQVYRKSYRLGERYGFAITPWDLTGNHMYSIGLPGFTDYQFPNRRDKFSTGHDAYSPDAIDAATVDSYNAQDTDTVHEVYEQGSTSRVSVLSSLGKYWNICSGLSGAANVYQPISPTGRGVGYGGNGNDTSFATVAVTSKADGNDNDAAFNCFGHSILGTGLKFGGVDPDQFPSHVSGFSVNRTKPAGRVVCQGLATYALTEHDGTNLQKALNKVWVHIPEIDSVIGDKSGLYEDIKNNPSDYSMELVSPVGFTTELYSGYKDILTSTDWGKCDIASYATPYKADGLINPDDDAADIGYGDGYVSFGRWRNVSGVSGNVGSGIGSSLTFSISSADDVDISGKNGRVDYLELTLGSNIYAHANNGASGSTDGDDADSRKFHEPWYVVNIIKSGKVIAQNNVNLYHEIGQYIKLNSVVGLGNGDEDQRYELVSERHEDVYSGLYGTTTMRYIYVNDQPWLEASGLSGATLADARDQIENNGYFTYNGVDFYGLYSVDIDGVSNNENRYTITFPYTELFSGTSICPGVGERIEVRYNKNAPIDIWGGDTIIDEVPVALIDCKAGNDWQAGSSYKDAHFRLSSAMPFYTYSNSVTPNYLQCKYPASGVVGNRAEAGNVVSLQWVRQWVSMFMLESTLNVPYLYKDFFPYRNYVMRPMKFDYKDLDETVESYLESLNIFPAYNTDYPDEYKNWDYGGFHLPQGYNFDYNKDNPKQYGSEPASGLVEVLNYPKRFQWSPKQSAGLYGLGVINTFPATNIYDLQLKEASEINILYSEYTNKGNNLYAVLDRGVVGLITDKRLLRDGIGDELGVMLSDSGFIQGEIWIDKFIGCPDKRWRGKCEGSFKSSRGEHVSGLVFVGDNDVYLLAQNSVSALSNNYRNTIVGAVGELDDSHIITSAFHKNRNELWLKLRYKMYIYNFTVGNWVAQVDENDLAGLASSKKYNSIRDAIVGVRRYITLSPTAYSGDIVVEDSGYGFASGYTQMAPYVTFAVTPGLDGQYRFNDIFVQSSIIPSSISVATDEDFTDPYTVSTVIKDVTGLYRVSLGRTTGGEVLIGNTLYVKITFAVDTEAALGYVKTGFSKLQSR